jgi:DNA polymerase elongation subunit (family B)
MTNPRKGVIPLSFDAQLKNAKINPDSVKKFLNERVLLNSFFAKLKQLDPDIVIVSSKFVSNINLFFRCTTLPLNFPC